MWGLPMFDLKDPVSREDTYRQAHETFDVDLLQSLTHTSARTFIRQYSAPGTEGLDTRSFCSCLRGSV